MRRTGFAWPPGQPVAETEGVGFLQGMVAAWEPLGGYLRGSPQCDLARQCPPEGMLSCGGGVRDAPCPMCPCILAQMLSSPWASPAFLEPPQRWPSWSPHRAQVACCSTQRRAAGAFCVCLADWTETNSLPSPSPHLLPVSPFLLSVLAPLLPHQMEHGHH